MIPIPSLTTIKYAAFGVAALVLAAGGFYAGYRWEMGAYQKLKAQDAQASAAAVTAALSNQRRVDQLNSDAAMRQVLAQQKIVTQTVTVTKEIPRYVHDQVICPGPTVGLARVLRAAAAGVDPASLSVAPGQSDDTCSDVTPSEVAGWFTDYASASRQNAEQLNGLVASIKANDATAESH